MTSMDFASAVPVFMVSFLSFRFLSEPQIMVHFECLHMTLEYRLQYLVHFCTIHELNMRTIISFKVECLLFNPLTSAFVSSDADCVCMRKNQNKNHNTIRNQISFLHSELYTRFPNRSVLVLFGDFTVC